MVSLTSDMVTGISCLVSVSSFLYHNGLCIRQTESELHIKYHISEEIHDMFLLESLLSVVWKKFNHIWSSFSENIYCISRNFHEDFFNFVRTWKGEK